LTDTLKFFKNHHSENEYAVKNEQENPTPDWLKDHTFVVIPDCTKLRKEMQLQAPFMLVDDDNNEYPCDPKDNGFRKTVKEIRMELKTK
jgi:hypothetical protein